MRPRATRKSRRTWTPTITYVRIQTHTTDASSRDPLTPRRLSRSKRVVNKRTCVKMKIKKKKRKRKKNITRGAVKSTGVFQRREFTSKRRSNVVFILDLCDTQIIESDPSKFSISPPVVGLDHRSFLANLMYKHLHNAMTTRYF